MVVLKILIYLFMLNTSQPNFNNDTDQIASLSRLKYTFMFANYMNTCMLSCGMTYCSSFKISL